MKNLVLSCYFTKKNDPQRKKRHVRSFRKFSRWYKSLIRLGMNGTIVHDQLPKRIISENACLQIRFHSYQLRKRWSINDERFLAWLEFLEQRPDVDNVFLTDLFDVDFFRDPFEIFTPKHDLYCGWGGALVDNCRYTKTKMRQAYGVVRHRGKPALNAGIIGGSRSNVLKLLRLMVSDFRRINSGKNLNMGVFNQRAHDLFPSRIMVGEPLHSRFKHYESDGNFCIRHK